jgi:single-strand DNA-binding protein
MLQLTATGNVGKDATLSKSGNDTAINFSIAVNRKYRNGQGVEVEETKWIDCTIWRKQGENTDIAQYIKAGTKMLVQGQPDIRWYVNNDGEVVVVQTLRVFSQELLSVKKEAAAEVKPQPGDLQPTDFDNQTPPAAAPAAKSPTRAKATPAAAPVQ